MIRVRNRFPAFRYPAAILAIGMAMCLAFAAGHAPFASAQESFFSGDYFIEEDVMVEGAFDAGNVTETYDEAVEEQDDEDSRRGSHSRSADRQEQDDN